MYIFISIIPFLLALTFTLIIRNLALKYSIYDNPEDDILKIHKQSVPCLGGVAMLLAISVGLTIAIVFLVKVNLWELVTILFCAVMAFGLGLWDDLKWKNSKSYKPNTKFILQILMSVLVGIILFSSGIRVQFIPIGIVGAVLAIFYVFGAINAVNMEDGLDGLAAGLVCISVLGFAILSYFIYDKLALTLSLCLLGAALGFLVYNFSPASIFMGDNGSHFLGFMLAALAIRFTSKPYDIRWFIGPILIIGLPVFDGIYTVLRRSIQRKPLFKGDRGHFYDRLNHRGLSIRQTVLICYFIQSMLVAGGLSLMYF